MIIAAICAISLFDPLSANAEDKAKAKKDCPVKELSPAPAEMSYFPEYPLFKSNKPLSLKHAVQIALKNNPNIDRMKNALKQSAYIHTVAAREWLPKISTDYSFTWFQKIPEFDYAGVSGPVALKTNFNWGVHVKWPIYTSGALKNRESMARFGIDVSRMQLFEAKSDLIQEVTINYFNILKQQNYVNVVSENVSRFTQHEEMTKKYFKVGIVGKNNLLEVQAKRANVQQDLIVAEKDLEISKAALKVIMGIDIHSAFELEDIKECRESPYSFNESCNMAARYNPSLVAFTFMKKRAEQAVKLAKTGTLPKIDTGLSYYRHGRTIALKGDDFYSNNILMGTVVFKWDIFDWFKTRHEVLAKKKDIDQLIDSYRHLSHNIALDIKNSHLNMLAANNKFKVATKGIEYAEENYRITRLRYEERVARSTEVNDALVLLRKSQFKYYTAFFEYNVALAQLERVTGANLLKKDIQTTNGAAK